MYAPDVIAPSVPWAIGSYALHAALVGMHTLAFFKSVRRLGTVPTAISKGAQQAGNFLFAHLFFCHVDRHECMWVNDGTRDGGGDGDGRGASWWATWSQWQKPAAFLLCCAGCVVYVLGKEPDAERRPELRGKLPEEEPEAQAEAEATTECRTEAEPGARRRGGGWMPLPTSER